jgi:hypothetical protein
MKRRKKKPSRKKLIKQADAAFSEYIRSLWPHCVTCGSTQNLTCSHLFSRRHLSTRWDEMNATVQCAPCNNRHNYDPHALTSWFLDWRGKKAYDELHERYCEITHLKSHDLEKIRDKFLAALEEKGRTNHGPS